MRYGSLFSGIGGLDLGLEWAGMACAWQCEKDDYARSILARHWPNVKRYEDIHDIDASSLGPVDLVCGGFPCQPVSLAGRRKGKGDDRWLWPEMLRIVEAVRPTWVLGENVVGLKTMGLDGILSDLENLCYATWQAIIPAGAVEAPHIRDRIFVVAHANGMWEPQPQGRESEQRGWIEHDSQGVLADSLRQRIPLSQQPDQPGQAERRIDAGAATYEPRSAWRSALWIKGSDGKTRAVKPGISLLAHGVPGRVAQVKALGNAVVPQVTYEIGRAIMAAHYGRM